MASGSGVKQDALGSYGQNQGEATQAFGTANPIYTQLATSTTGYTPQQQADMLTQAAQARGGATAGVVGQGNLMAARTSNPGAYSAVLDDAARNAGAGVASDALGVDAQNAQLQLQKQQIGLSGLGQEYGTGTQAGVGYLGAANNAAQPFWQQALLSGIKAGGQVGAAALGG